MARRDSPSWPHAEAVGPSNAAKLRARRSGALVGSHTRARVGIEESEERDEDVASACLSEDICEHDGAFDVEDADDITGDEVAQKFGSTQDVLGKLECDGVEGEIDGGLGVAVDDGRAGRWETKLEKDLANKNEFFGGEHAPEELGFGA